MMQPPSNHRQINRLEEPRDRVLFLGAQALAPDEKNHQDWDHRDCENRGERNRKGLGVGERPKHPPFLRFEQEYRQERDDDNNQREENGPADLLRGRQQDSLSFGFGYRLASQRRQVLRLGQVPVPVFDHHDRSVHQHAYRQCQPSQRHDVGADLQIVHRNKRRDDRDRQPKNRKQGGPQVKEKNDDHQTYNDGLFEQVAFQSIDGGLNESRPIVASDDFDTSRQSLFNPAKLLLDSVDDGQGILPVTHHDDAADGLSIAVP